MVDGRASVTGLFETNGARDSTDEIALVQGVDDFHVGLTGQHIEIGLTSCFNERGCGSASVGSHLGFEIDGFSTEPWTRRSGRTTDAERDHMAAKGVIVEVGREIAAVRVS